jgi:hypothetical protein
VHATPCRAGAHDERTLLMPGVRTDGIESVRPGAANFPANFPAEARQLLGEADAMPWMKLEEAQDGPDTLPRKVRCRASAQLRETWTDSENGQGRLSLLTRILPQAGFAVRSCSPSVARRRRPPALEARPAAFETRQVTSDRFHLT